MPLNSYDGRSPLREVVLGSADAYTSHEWELLFELFYYEEMPHREIYYPRHVLPGAASSAPGAARRLPVKQRYLTELQEEVAGMAEILEGLGVTVHRRLPFSRAYEVRTPVFDAAVVPPLNIRDNTLILGNEIIETPPADARPLLRDAVRRVLTSRNRLDRDATSVDDRRVVRPAPHGGRRSVRRRQRTRHRTQPCTLRRRPRNDNRRGTTPRLGPDVFVNVATANHTLAFNWLERHLDGRFRLHRMDRLADSHIDSMVLALFPALLLVRNPLVADRQPKQLRSWDMVFPPEPEDNTFRVYDNDDLVLTSPYIDLNVLSVVPDTALVDAACRELMRTLERRRFTVVPVRYRHRRLFSGGLHFFTLDTVRGRLGPGGLLLRRNGSREGRRCEH